MAERRAQRRSGKGTHTSAFGSSGRISHDSSAFYRRRLYPDAQSEKNVEYCETPLPPDVADRIFPHTSERMEELPDCSVHLTVTSPPYNVGKEYDQDLSLADYRDLLRRVMAETYRVLVPGGRLCINVANLGRRPYVPLHLYVAQDAADVGFLMRGEVIWDKGASAAASTAWGSWRSASNPTLRDTHEYILVFCKETYRRPKLPGREPTITDVEFLEYTKSVWTFPAESARRIGHPAPFPVELPHRCIQLYTYEGEVVLDPFMGVGATAVAAARAGRRFVGYDVSADYCRRAEERLAKLRRDEADARPALAVAR